MKPILWIRDVTVDFAGFKALNQIDFEMRQGEVHFLIGPNGAGKTTLLDVICGKVKPERGEVIFKGEIDLTQLQEYQIARLGVGRKFQAPSVFGNLTVFENLELSMQQNRNLLAALRAKLSAEERDQIWQQLEMINLLDFAHMKAETLAHGQKQWLEIGMLLMQNPELLLLDEPVAGMTKPETEKTGQLIQELRKPVRCWWWIMTWNLSENFPTM